MSLAIGGHFIWCCFLVLLDNVESFSAAIIMPNPLFRIRAITAFVNLAPSDFDGALLENKIQEASKFLCSMENKLTTAGYEVQTLRIATNPFGEYLASAFELRLQLLQSLLSKYKVSFCSLGPARSVYEVSRCPKIVEAGMTCSAAIGENDVIMAKAVADCMLKISKLNDPPSLDGGLGNFNFCAAACCPAGIPFFPAAHAGGDHTMMFAVGLENGPLAYKLLSETKSIAHVSTTFRDGMAEAIQPIQDLCSEEEESSSWTFRGIDTSLNPSLDDDDGMQGSVAAALEQLEEVKIFGGPGSVAGAAAVTKALQSLPGITTTGYCGYMLPVCEDKRLAELSPTLRISNLLSISAVCGVGIDTVPLAGDVSVSELTSLLLDVTNLAHRWNKPLSCRVFPVPGQKAGGQTQFDASPYLCNSQIFSIE